MYKLQCYKCKTPTGLNQSFRHYRTYAAHMVLYHPHDNKLEDKVEEVEEPINPDPIGAVNRRIEDLTNEVEKLRLKNIELENNVIVDMKELRFIKSINKNNSDKVVEKESGDDDNDDDE